MKNIVLFKSRNNNAYLYNTFTKGLYLLDNISSLLADEIEQERNIDLINTEFILDKLQIIITDKELLTYKNKIKHYIAGHDNSQLFNSVFLDEISVQDVYHVLANKPQIVFEVTEQCNLKCKYCALGDLYEVYKPRTGKDLSIYSAKKLIKYIYDICQSDYCKIPNNTINIGFYGGEPLLKFDFIKEIVLYTQALTNNRISFSYSMTTNCILLDKYADFLKAHEFALLLSLDGNFYNNGYRVFKNGENAFDRIFNNINFLRDSHPEYFEKQVRFNAVLHNKNSVPEILTFFDSHFGKKPLISEITIDSRTLEERKLELLTIYKSKRDFFDNSNNYEFSYKQNPNFRRVLNFLLYLTNLVYVNYSFLNSGTNRPIKSTGTCIPFSRKIFVSATGNILHCEHISHQYYVGKLKNGKHYLNVEKITKQFNTRIKKMKKFCSKCYLVTNCSQCIYSSDVLNTQPITCKEYTNKSRFADYLSNVISFIEDYPQIFKEIIFNIEVS